MSQRVIDNLSESECYELIRQEAVGRLVFQDSEGPAALPVNFGIAGNRVIFRVEEGSHLRDVLDGPVAFEVDASDDETSMGWSVLIRGTGAELDMEEVPGLLRQMHGDIPHPWAEGVHNVWVAVTPRKITGRKLTTPFFAAIF